MKLLFKQRVKIGRISYINVDPIYYGLENHSQLRNCQLISKPPSVLNKMLAKGELDISPVSSSAYAKNQNNWMILPDLSVSCFGNVLSVLFVSMCDIKELSGEKVVIDDESKTAADLLKLFLYSQDVKPVFVRKKVKIHSDVKEKAALVIGDAALISGWNNNFKYVYDLGDLWQEMTNLPFVFALWVADKSFAKKSPEIVSEITDAFYLSRQQGIKNIDTIISCASKKIGISNKQCKRYFSKLDFNLGRWHIKGLDIFFDKLWKDNFVNKKVTLNFFP